MANFAKKLNLNYIDQITYLQGMHRSGWPFVMLHLMSLQNDKGVLCDTYVDRTFLWNSSENDFIPYTVPWIGFIHHTFDTSFSKYNNVTLLQNENFLRSLPTCKGLFVFSSVSKDKWNKQLRKMGYNIPIEQMVHPTQFVKTRFTMKKFKDNSERNIVQVGAWLRDNYAIYRLNGGKAKFNLENGTSVHKAALIGPKMENYYKPFDFFRHFRNQKWKSSDVVPIPMLKAATDTVDTPNYASINGELPPDIVSDVQTGTTDGMCRDIMCRDSDFALNKYVKGAIELLKDFDNSVNTYPTMTDSEYDTFLSENIVFLKMVDAAAVNTLQECIVRNTPIVINPLPAIVEILGENYPLYYNNLDEVPKLVTLQRISEAHDYLVNMDKDSLKIDYFINSLTKSDIYANLDVSQI